MSGSTNQRLLQLAGLLQLQHRARQVRAQELAFLMVNETMGVLPYQQAILWRAEAASAARIVLSGVAEPAPGAPYRDWAKRLVDTCLRSEQAARPHIIAAADLPKEIVATWAEWFPENALWCPLPHPDGRLLGVLILGRVDAWSAADLQAMELLASQYGQCLALDSQRHRRWMRPKHGLRRPIAIPAVLAVIAVLLTLPVRRSVVAPAEVVAIDPAPVRAPFEGVVAVIHVQPNALVHAGDKIVSLERAQLQTQYDVAAKALELARAEYVVTSQQAMNDPQAKAKLALLGGKIEQRASELAYAKGLLDRADLTASIDGVAVFDNTADWIGKPVAVGERIMQIASPTSTQLEIQVPAADAVTFERGAEVVFFSNVSPETLVPAALDYASYAAAPAADGTMAYIFRARFRDPAPERLGVKGTAKIYGSPQALGLWLLRRPLAVMRQWLAL